MDDINREKKRRLTIKITKSCKLNKRSLRVNVLSTFESRKQTSKITLLGFYCLRINATPQPCNNTNLVQRRLWLVDRARRRRAGHLNQREHEETNYHTSTMMGINSWSVSYVIHSYTSLNLFVSFLSDFFVAIVLVYTYRPAEYDVVYELAFVRYVLIAETAFRTTIPSRNLISFIGLGVKN